MSIKRFAIVCLFLLAFCVAVVTENGIIPESLPSVIAQSVTERKAEADRLLQQGNQQYQISQYREAFQSWESALQIYREIKDRQGEANSLGNLGNAYYSLGQYEKAIEYYQQSLAIAREIKYRQGEANSLGNLGVAYYSLGQYEKAIEYHQQYLAIAREIKDRQGEANALGNLGIAYRLLGQYEKAIEYHQQSLAIAREIKDRQGEANSLGNLGIAYRLLGQYEKAIEYHQQSLAIKREIKDRQGEANSLGNLGNAYYSLGQYEKAIEYHQQSLAIKREIQDRQGQAQILGNLGIAYGSLGQYEKEIDYHQQSLAIAREIKDRQGEANSLGNLGNAYYSLGQYEKAIEYHQQSLAIKREIKDRRGEANSLGNLGNAYSSLGQYEKALEYHQQYLAIAREIKDRQGEALALNNLGATYNTLKQYPEAEKVLLNAVGIFESIRTKDLPDASKVALFETYTRTFYNLQTALIAQNKTDLALETSERGRARAFVELMSAKLTDNAPIKPLTLTEIQQVARQQNATLVEYYLNPFDKALYIWVINPKGNITFKSVPLENTSLPDLINTSRQALGVRGGRGLAVVYYPNPNAQDNSRQLYQFLIEPIQSALPSNPEDRIIFIPHQSLFSVPFAALQDKSGRYLIDNHTILTAPAIQVLQLTHKGNKKRQGNALIVGNPAMPKIFTVAGEEKAEQLLPLPGAEREAQAIAKLLNTQAIIGKNATKSAILKQLPSAKIAHFATHGLLDDFKGIGVPGAIAFAPDPNNSEINNGLLTSSEILDLKLNLDLMVLSACDTGRGNITGDGVVGLSRSLLTAGVSSLVVSLWAVPDAPTADLMTEFYQQWQKNPDKAKALRDAQLATKVKHPEPRNWAAFTLIGESE